MINHYLHVGNQQQQQKVKGFLGIPSQRAVFLNTWQSTTSWDPGWESLASKYEMELKMQILDGAGSGEPCDSSELV